MTLSARTTRTRIARLWCALAAPPTPLCALGRHSSSIDLTSHPHLQDVYSRRRQKVRRSIGDGDAVPAFSRAVETCLDMVTHAAADADSERAFCLSKSLQLMAEFLVQVVRATAHAARISAHLLPHTRTSLTSPPPASSCAQDVPSFAARGTWERATTLSYLTTTLEIATRLPLFPEEMEVILKDDWRAPTARPAPPPRSPWQPPRRWPRSRRCATRRTRGAPRKANAIRQLVHGVEQAPSWPPPHGWQPPVNEA